MNTYKYAGKTAAKINKVGHEVTVYGEQVPGASVVHIAINGELLEEFLNTVSYMLYYIYEGKGEFSLNGEKILVESTDLVVVPPNTKIHYRGAMKMVLTVTPPFKEENELRVSEIHPA